MNKTKPSNPIRLIAFFLVSVILICTFGFTVDGWTITDNTNQPSSDSINDTEEGDFNDDEILDDEGGEDETTDTVVPPYNPEYISYITGLEITKEEHDNRPISLLINPSEDSFGISSAEMMCEIPVEGGDTRALVTLRSVNDLWKIGSFAPTRNYISNLSKYFDSILLSGGNDEKLEYDSCDASEDIFDLSIHTGYNYTEYSRNIYTNCDLIDAGIKNLGFRTKVNDSTKTPYLFYNFECDEIPGDLAASNIAINYSKTNSTELVYNEETRSYTLYKNGSIKTDASSGKTIEFVNCLILFADSATYENSVCSQMVLDTVGEGVGYYCYSGAYQTIRWSATTAGVMTLYSSSGEKLSILRGEIYLAFIKSSMMDSVSFT